MRNKLNKLFTVVAILLTVGVGNVWGWSMMYLVGDHWNSWSDQYRMWETSSNSGKRYVYIYMEKDYMFRFNMVISETSYKVGCASAQNLDDDDSGVRVYKYDSGDPAHINYSGDADHTYSGILCINADQATKDGSDDADQKPFIWVRRPSVKIRHNWAGTGWSDESMTDKQNGKYEYIGQYGGNYTYAGITDNEYNQDGSPLYKKFTDATLEGSPVVGNRCLFEFNSSGYVGVEDADHYRGSLKIIKIDTVTYNANGATGGTAPAVTEATYNRASTLATNTGSLSKTNYYFNGWNTQANGKGTHYDAGGSITVSGNTTLYAEWTPQWTVKGGNSVSEEDDKDKMGDWKVFNGLEFVSGHTHRGTVSLDAHTAYYFKIYDRNTPSWYGCGTGNNDYTYVGQTDAVAINSTPGNNVLLLTTQAGEYTFEWTDDTHTLKIIYPNTISHPSMDYVYMERYSDWNSGSHCYIHYFYDDGGDGETMTTWGTDNPKMTAYTTFGGTDYYCFPILTDYPNFIAKNNLGASSDGHETGKMYTSGHAGQIAYWKDAGTGWTWKGVQVHIALDDRGANTNVNPTYFDIDYNSAVLTDLTSIPLKDNYDFQGFYTNSDGTGTQVIDDAGQWIASVTDYTDASKHWIHPGCTTTVYAKWTETPRTITLQVSPEGAGSLSAEGSDGSTITAYISTATPTITATPSHAAWKFKRWVYGTNVGNKDGTGSDNTVQITSSANSTLTAVFEPRFTLVGSKAADGNPAGGMPGWTDADADAKAFTVVSTSPSVELIKECTLDASTLYKFEIHDRIDGNFGDGTDGMYNLIEGNTAHCTNSNKDMLFTTTGAGKYIFKITAIDGSNRASVQLLWPHQTNFGRRRVDIDGTAHDDNTGGTLAVTSGGEAVSTGSWHTYGTNIAYDANNNTGYQLTWYTSSEYSSIFSAGGEWNHDLISNDNCYAQFTELATPVTLSNDGHGKVQISSEDATNTTCGITTTRSLAAVANTGYVFSSWSKSGDDINLSTTAATPTTLSSLGGGVGEGQSVTANFSAKTYSVKLNNDHGGASSEDGSATATYDAISLSSITDAKFSGWTLLGYWNSDAVQVVNANGSLCANVDGYTDSDSKWTNDAGSTVNLWAHWSRSVTLDDNGDYGGNGAVTVSYNSTAGTPTITTTPTRSDYAVEGYYTNAACTTKVMEPSGKLIASVSGYTDSNGKWTKTDATTLYTKWIYVIYRTGDSSGDSHKSVYHESYAGGTIPTEIEFRMKVSQLDHWYSLCLPFDVSAVKVWDEEDGKYYNLKPYWRADKESPLQNGHYIIRTPNFSLGSSIAIEDFDDWRDPTSPTDYVPSKNTPYIIQWHTSYFHNRYVSFFGATGQEIPTSMGTGSAPEDNSVVNVFGNNSMTTGYVAGAYMLDPDYGAGAWLRLDNVETLRAIPPFECFIRASSENTGKFLVIQRDMLINTPTGFYPVTDNPSSVTRKVLVDGQLYILRGDSMYTIQGTLVK